NAETSCGQSFPLRPPKPYHPGWKARDYKAGATGIPHGHPPQPLTVDEFYSACVRIATELPASVAARAAQVRHAARPLPAVLCVLTSRSRVRGYLAALWEHPGDSMGRLRLLIATAAL